MADWRKLAKALALADSHIDEREVQIIRDELFDDNVIDQSELDFLMELKREASSAVPTLDQLIQECQKSRGGK